MAALVVGILGLLAIVVLLVLLLRERDGRQTAMGQLGAEQHARAAADRARDAAREELTKAHDLIDRLQDIIERNGRERRQLEEDLAQCATPEQVRERLDHLFTGRAA